MIDIMMHLQYHFSALVRSILLVMYFDDLKRVFVYLMVLDFGDVHWFVDCSAYFGV